MAAITTTTATSATTAITTKATAATHHFDLVSFTVSFNLNSTRKSGFKDKLQSTGFLER